MLFAEWGTRDSIMGRVQVSVDTLHGKMFCCRRPSIPTVLRIATSYLSCPSTSDWPPRFVGKMFRAFAWLATIDQHGNVTGNDHSNLHTILCTENPKHDAE